MNRIFLICLCFCLTATLTQAEIQTKTITYQDGDQQLEGFLAWDDTIQDKQPGVLVVHEWWGLNNYARHRATQLAALGYVAFAADMYGKGQVTTHPDEAGKWMNTIQQNIQAWQTRAQKALAVLQAQTLVDSQRLAAIGYCFGGATVVQLAYSGAPVKGIVSFHGSLPLPPNTQQAKTKAKIFIAHGHADPFISKAHIQNFQTALDQAGVDWQMVLYAGARHSFTNPGADQHGMDALRYDQDADRRSWQHMQLFFDEIFEDTHKF
ncbi:MAG: dienelactone hydrolase family protein [Nitrospirales bacterium]|nr:dienelactone hydrolase family protein [Nitrospirales bacterium]